MNPHPMDMSKSLQNAETKADHEALAQHYEEAAKEMQLKLMNIKNFLPNMCQKAIFTADRQKI